MEIGDIGRWLVVTALVMAAVGGVLMAADALGLGRLPGDLRFGTGNVRVYVPIATSILISIVLTVVLNLFFRR